MPTAANVERPVPSLTVTVIGMGYVGLPTALALLESGAQVTGYDVSAHRLEAITRGDVDLIAEDHARLARYAPDGSGPDGRLRLSDAPGVIADSDAVIVAVPTPVTDHHEPDLTALRAACAEVVSHARAGQTIILTSTTYVGCTRDLLVEPLATRGLTAGRDIHVAFSPERIDPGNAVHTQETTPRVVGGATPACTEAAAEVVGRCARAVHRVSSAEAAEMTKLLENTFRAVNIAWINEMADVADVLGLSISEVIEAATTKGYGFMPFTPGPGVGGHCIPCDPHYLLWQLRATTTSAPITAHAMDGLARRPSRVVGRAMEILAATRRRGSDARVCLAGVAYKPGVRDLRESPAVDILEMLAGRDVEVSYHDPLIPSLTLADGTMLRSVPSGDLAEVDLVIWHTAHPVMDPALLLAGDVEVLDATYRLPDSPRTHRL